MEDDLLERLPALRGDEEPDGMPAGGERLLDRAAAGDELLAFRQLFDLAADGRRLRLGGRAPRRGRPLEAAQPGSRSRAGSRSRGREWPGSRATCRRAPPIEGRAPPIERRAAPER
ncbi:MAG TPA: hypothetical protein VNH13_03955 [Candidatus Acidoferrales bacterium]|nr:hypothetical protein [Candidatus Acidoferrales bacterium]